MWSKSNYTPDEKLVSSENTPAEIWYYIIVTNDRWSKPSTFSQLSNNLKLFKN